MRGNAPTLRSPKPIVTLCLHHCSENGQSEVKMKRPNEQHPSSGTSKRCRLLENNWHPLQHAEHGNPRQQNEPSQLHKLLEEHAEEINSILKQLPHWPSHTPEEMDPVPDTGEEPEDEAQREILIR